MDDIALIRSFNRSYTRVLGLLDDHILDSEFSLSEARILYEIAHTPQITAQQLVHRLPIDKGYLSRLLKKLMKKGLVETVSSEEDKRYKLLFLTEKGLDQYRQLDTLSSGQIASLLDDYNPYERDRFVSSLGQVLQLLNRREGFTVDDIRIRNHFVSGDIGFIIQAHGELYGKEYNYGFDFEKYVAEEVNEFVSSYDERRSRIWMCEHNRNRVGFLALQDRGELAQLRYFFILPEYRGIGLGNELMNRFMDFLNGCGYKGSYLITNSHLTPATSLYRKFGFNLHHESMSNAFGVEVSEQEYRFQFQGQSV